MYFFLNYHFRLPSGKFNKVETMIDAYTPTEFASYQALSDSIRGSMAASNPRLPKANNFF